MPDSSDSAPVLDTDKIIATLNEYGVEYIIVGGIGAQIHGAERITTDFDYVIKSADQNLDHVVNAMKELGAFMRVDKVSDYVARDFKFDMRWMIASQDVTTWRTTAGDIDIMRTIPNEAGERLTYDALIPNADERTQESVHIWVAGLDDIIASKQFANRQKDRDALPELIGLRHSKLMPLDIPPEPESEEQSELDF